MHDTDKIERGLMMLFFVLVFSLTSLEISLPTPLTVGFIGGSVKLTLKLLILTYF